MQIYDPRIGQDFEITNFITGKRFSSLVAGLFVICGEDLDWSARIGLIDEAISKSSRIGFITIKPWFPNSKKVFQSAKSLFTNAREFENSLIAYVDIRESVRTAFEIRSQYGAANSGEWCIGGCLSELTPPERLSFARGEFWDFAHILGQAERIGCALELAEMQQSTFVTRIFDGFDEWFSKLNLTNLG